MGILSTVIESTKPKLRAAKTYLIPVIASVAVSVIAAPHAAAVNYDAEIKKLQTQNTAQESNRQDLQATAMTLQAKITNLQTTISALNNLMEINMGRRSDLAQQIVAVQGEIDKEQTILNDSIRKLYIENDMSMLEKMASSKTLSDYVDKEQYTLSAQASVKRSLDHITNLKNEQQQEKTQVDQLLADNKLMQSQLATQKQELDTLLAGNQNDQAAVSQTIDTNNNQITDLQRQQAEENARFLREQAALAAAAQRKAAASGTPVVQQAAPAGISAVSGYSYPWANAPWPNDISDPWGMYQRQCVSYTAWKVASSGRHMPYWGGRGNANQWDDNARNAGIPTDGNPRVGDVAVRNAGTYGHVMYVDAVNSDGSINISQYNANWEGRYSEARIFPGDLVFIHF
jgi:surface antigen